VFGLFVSLFLKYFKVKYLLEVSLVLIMAYLSYLISTLLKLTGIVSLLFCGMTLKHYALPSVSRRARQSIGGLSSVVSYLSENLIFIHLGMTVFIAKDERVSIWVVLSTFFGVLFARFVSVFSLSYLLNAWSRLLNRTRMWRNSGYRSHRNDASSILVESALSDSEADNAAANRESHQTVETSRSDDVIPRNHQIILWWAGLRGAIAFALSMDLNTPDQELVKTTVLIVVILSIYTLGGSTSYALKKFKVIDATQQVSGNHEEELDHLELSGTATSLASQNDSWFMRLDKNYLIPFFTRQDMRSSREEEERRLLSRRGSIEQVALVDLDRM
jgi:sodium/hydrogen exchanger-like protein 6/7